MNNLGDYLKKFEVFLEGPKAEKEAILKAIKSASGLDVTDSEIEVKDGTVYINASPAVKNELFMYRKKIIEKLEESLKKKSPKNIR